MASRQPKTHDFFNDLRTKKKHPLWGAFVREIKDRQCVSQNLLLHVYGVYFATLVEL